MPVTRYKTVINAGNCTIVGDFNKKYCIPIKQDCTPTKTGWILNECGSNYCDTYNSLVDVPFTMVYSIGDKIQFQFRLDDNWNEDKASPVDGWGSFVTGKYFDKDGNLLSSDFSQYASKYMVGYDGTSSYQIIEIDTQLLSNDGIKCFSFQAMSHTQTEPDIQQTVCTELFGQAECKDTVLIQGLYTQYDCFNNWYGEPVAYVGTNFKYNNTLRFVGKLWKSPDRIKRELIAQKMKSSVYDDIYNFRIHDIVPAFVMKTCDQFFNAPIILIDGQEYQCDEFSPEQADTGFIVNQEVYLRCESTTNNCNN